MEAEYALDQIREGHLEGIIGIQIDEFELSHKPDWLAPIEIERISTKSLQEHDRLIHIRDEIGKNIPTYMDDVTPNFIKHIRKSHLTEHLEMCDGPNLDIWHLNGASTLDEYVVPAIEELLRRDKNMIINARVLLLDSASFPESPLSTKYDFDHEFPLQERLKASGFYKKNGVHPEQVKESVEILRELEKKYESVSFEFKLTERIPAARVIIFGRYGFFSPFMHRMHSGLSVLVFDDQSPFFEPILEYFNDAYETARYYD